MLYSNKFLPNHQKPRAHYNQLQENEMKQSHVYFFSCLGIQMGVIWKIMRVNNIKYFLVYKGFRTLEYYLGTFLMSHLSDTHITLNKSEIWEGSWTYVVHNLNLINKFLKTQMRKYDSMLYYIWISNLFGELMKTRLHILALTWTYIH